MNRKPRSVYTTHESQKKTAYNERVISVEHGTFTPLIFSTTGGFGNESITYHKRLASLIARKRNEEYPLVISYIRRKLRFSLLRSTLIAIRGTRTVVKKMYYKQKLSDVDINLIEAIHNTK